MGQHPWLLPLYAKVGHRLIVPFGLSAYCCILLRALLVYVNQSKGLISGEDYHIIIAIKCQLNS
jgi:hypothetical protein